MQLQEEDIREFVQLWKEEFDEALSMEQARQHASGLMELYALLAKPLPQTQRESPDADSQSSL